MKLSIDDLRLCPALAGPDDVAMLIGVIDALRSALAAALVIARQDEGAA